MQGKVTVTLKVNCGGQVTITLKVRCEGNSYSHTQSQLRRAQLKSHSQTNVEGIVKVTLTVHGGGQLQSHFQSTVEGTVTVTLTGHFGGQG